MNLTEWASYQVNEAIEKYPSQEKQLKNALKTYTKLMDDGHSGMSFSITKHLIKELKDSFPTNMIGYKEMYTKWLNEWLGETCRSAKAEDLLSKDLTTVPTQGYYCNQYQSAY